MMAQDKSLQPSRQLFLPNLIAAFRQCVNVESDKGFMECEAVIGLETHVQLKTKSKMWCGCANEFGAAPNTNVCPVCLGLPGVLPVANDEGLKLTVLTGYLLNCTIPTF